MDLALNNLQRLICHKTQQTKPSSELLIYMLNIVPRNINATTHFFVKYIYIYIYHYFSFFFRVEISENVRERQGDKGRRMTQTQICGGLGRLLYWPFLTHWVIPYSWPNLFASLMRGTQPGSAVDRCLQSRHSLAVILVILCLTVPARLTVLTWVPVYA